MRSAEVLALFKKKTYLQPFFFLFLFIVFILHFFFLFSIIINICNRVSNVRKSSRMTHWQHSTLDTLYNKMEDAPESRVLRGCYIILATWYTFMAILSLFGQYIG
jgi:hypothetical protein